MVERTGTLVPHTLDVPDALDDDASSQDCATDEEDAILSSCRLFIFVSFFNFSCHHSSPQVQSPKCLANRFIKLHPHLSLTSVKFPPLPHGPSRPSNLAVASSPSSPLQPHPSGSPMARNRTYSTSTSSSSLLSLSYAFTLTSN